MAQVQTAKHHDCPLAESFEYHIIADCPSNLVVAQKSHVMEMLPVFNLVV